jgi:hypothetical protein
MNTFKANPMDTKAFDAFAKAGISMAVSYFNSIGDLARLAFEMNPMLKMFEEMKPKNSCDTGCEIPPACWLPECLGEVSSFVRPGGTASLRIRVTNCQPRPSTIQVTFGRSDFPGKVVPPSASLGPMERETFNVSFTAPADAAEGHKVESLVWVNGCNAHYLRWTIVVAECACDGCHEIEVKDCQDLVHHWYDHFYCQRQCFHTGRTNQG